MDSVALEADSSIFCGEQGEVSACADVEAGAEFCAALAYENRAGLCDFAGVELYAPVFGVAVAAVPC